MMYRTRVVSTEDSLDNGMNCWCRHRSTGERNPRSNNRISNNQQYNHPVIDHTQYNHSYMDSNTYNTNLLYRKQQLLDGISKHSIS